MAISNPSGERRSSPPWNWRLYAASIQPGSLWGFDENSKAREAEWTGHMKCKLKKINRKLTIFCLLQAKDIIVSSLKCISTRTYWYDTCIISSRMDCSPLLKGGEQRCFTNLIILWQNLLFFILLSHSLNTLTRTWCSALMSQLILYVKAPLWIITMAPYFLYFKDEYLHNIWKFHEYNCCHKSRGQPWH